MRIVEDAAQAIGAEWSGRGAGSLGVTAAFSFYPTKNLSAYGDAGIVTTIRPEMAEHMRQLRNHGSPRRYYHHEFGWNGRMDAIQAAVLRVKLTRIADWNRLPPATRRDLRPAVRRCRADFTGSRFRVKARRCACLRGLRTPSMCFISM